MINYIGAVSYCKEDICKIENYDIANSDINEKWVCHHRLEIIENKTSTQLKMERRYYNRPASELIFLTHSEHSLFHNECQNNFINSNNNKEIYQYDLKFKLIKKWNSLLDITKELQIKPSDIIKSCEYISNKPIKGNYFRFNYVYPIEECLV